VRARARKAIATGRPLFQIVQRRRRPVISSIGRRPLLFFGFEQRVSVKAFVAALAAVAVLVFRSRYNDGRHTRSLSMAAIKPLPADGGDTRSLGAG
jgi:hypothetical protein